MKRNTTLALGIAISLTLCLYNCTTQQTGPPVFTNKDKPTYDSLNTWLRNPNNLQDSAIYFSRVYPNSDAAIKQGKYDDAARILVSCGYCLDQEFLGVPFFHAYLIDFIRKHEKQVLPVLAKELNYFAAVEYFGIPNPDSAMVFLRRVPFDGKSFEDKSIEGLTQSMLSFAYLVKAKMDSAATYGLSAVHTFESIGDTANMGKAYDKLYLVYSKMAAYKEADKYITKSIELARSSKDDDDLRRAYANKFYNAFYLHDTTAGIAAANEILRTPGNMVDKGTAFMIYHIGAESMRSQGKYDRMAIYIDSCKQLFDGHERRETWFTYQDDVGRYELKTKGQISNRAEIQQGAEFFTKLHNYYRAYYLYSMLSKDAANRGDFADAYRYKIQEINGRDSLWNEEQRGRIHELFIQYQTKEQTQQITFLEREKQLSLQRNALIGGLLFLLLIGVIYWAVRQRQRHRRELSGLTQLLLERNTQLSNALEEIHPNEQPSGAVTDGDSDLFNQVILTEADWEQFQASFNKAYPGYLSGLRTRHPELTPGEIRLVLLDKMGLSLKEAATILGVSIDAIKKGRYRMKKKFNLSGDDLASM
jgi:DNA-binding CsgD family transcriptional regulator